MITFQVIYLSTLLAQKNQEVVYPSSLKTEVNNVSSESLEFVHIKLQASHSKDMNIIAVFCPPYHNDLTRFTSDIDDLITSIPDLETTVIGGDIKIKLLSPDNSERAFVEVMFSSSFDQHITVPTRVTEKHCNPG